MRVFVLFVLIMTGGVVQPGVAQQQEEWPHAAIPDGTWEGVIEGRIRPAVVIAEFASGTVKLDGAASVPIKNLSNQAGRTRFQAIDLKKKNC